MNNSIAVFLINDKVRAVVGIYEAEVNGLVPSTSRAAPRTVFKTLDQRLKVGDIVIVPSGTRHGFTTNKIVETDIEPDLDSKVEMKWVVARLDKDEYEDILRMENEAIVKINSAEKAKKRRELAAALLLDPAAIKGLAISNAGSTLQPPEAPQVYALRVCP